MTTVAADAGRPAAAGGEKGSGSFCGVSSCGTGVTTASSGSPPSGSSGESGSSGSSPAGSSAGTGSSKSPRASHPGSPRPALVPRKSPRARRRWSQLSGLAPYRRCPFGVRPAPRPGPARSSPSRGRRRGAGPPPGRWAAPRPVPLPPPGARPVPLRCRPDHDRQRPADRRPAGPEPFGAQYRSCNVFPADLTCVRRVIREWLQTRAADLIAVFVPGFGGQADTLAQHALVDAEDGRQRADDALIRRRRGSPLPAPDGRRRPADQIGQAGLTHPERRAAFFDESAE